MLPGLLIAAGLVSYTVGFYILLCPLFSYVASAFLAYAVSTCLLLILTVSILDKKNKTTNLDSFSGFTRDVLLFSGVLFLIAFFVFNKIPALFSSTNLKEVPREFKVLEPELNSSFIGVYSLQRLVDKARLENLKEEAIKYRVNDTIREQLVNGKVYLVAFLDFANLKAWTNEDFVPGYFLINPRDDKDVKYVSQLNNQPIRMKYTSNSFWKQNAERKVFLDQGYLIGESFPMINDEGRPFTVVQLLERKRFIFDNSLAKIATIDSQTGDIQSYDLDKLPPWIQRNDVVSYEDLHTDVVLMIHNKYPNETTVSSRDVRKVFIDNQTFFLIPVIRSESFIASFALLNPHTKEISFKDLSDLRVKDTSSSFNLMKEYNYAVGGEEDTLRNIYYKEEVKEAELFEGRVKRISSEIQDGVTVYYILLDKKDMIFKAPSSLSPEMVLTKPKDKVTIRFNYPKTDLQLSDLIYFDNKEIK